MQHDEFDRQWTLAFMQLDFKSRNALPVQQRIAESAVRAVTCMAGKAYPTTASHSFLRGISANNVQNCHHLV